MTDVDPELRDAFKESATCEWYANGWQSKKCKLHSICAGAVHLRPRIYRGAPGNAAMIDDVIERLVFLAKIETGLAELDRSEGVPHDETKRHCGR
jgi:hypothetical protein